jgi:hypothetical protein
VVCGNCGYIELYDKNEYFMAKRKFTCVVCKHIFCPHCYEIPHEGMNCDEFKKMRVDRANEAEF